MKLYKLSEQVIQKLKNEIPLRRGVAGSMGNGESAVLMDLPTGGQNIAMNYDAINYIMDKTGLLVSDIRVKNY